MSGISASSASRLSTARRGRWGAESSRRIQLFAKVTIAFLRRVECGQPHAGIGCSGGLGKRDAGIRDAQRRSEHRRNAPRSDARSACLLGIGDDRGGDLQFRSAEIVWCDGCGDLFGQRQTGQVEAIRAGAFELRSAARPARVETLLVDPDRLEPARRIKGADRRSPGAPIAVADRIAWIADDQAIGRRSDRRRDWRRGRARATRRKRLGRRRRGWRRVIFDGSSKDDPGETKVQGARRTKTPRPGETGGDVLRLKTSSSGLLSVATPDHGTIWDAAEDASGASAAVAQAVDPARRTHAENSACRQRQPMFIIRSRHANTIANSQLYGFMARR